MLNDAARTLFLHCIYSAIGYSRGISFFKSSVGGRANCVSDALLYRKIISMVAKDPKKYGVAIVEGCGVDKHVQIACQFDTLVDYSSFILQGLMPSMLDINEFAEGRTLTSEAEIEELNPLLLKLN